MQAISGNICRCTGYAAIIDAVLDAARRVREARRAGEGEGGVMERIDPGFFADERAADLSVVGTTVPRADARGHVTGRTQFHEDVSFPDTLHLVMVRSTRHHAKFTLDVAPALAVPGVVRVLTHKDVPQNWYTILRLIGVGRTTSRCCPRTGCCSWASRSARCSPRPARRRWRARGGSGSTTRSCRRSSTSRRRSRRRRSRRTARTTSSTRATTAAASASATWRRASPRPTTSSSSATNPRRSSMRRWRPPAARRSRRATAGSPSTPTPRRSTSPSTTWR